MNDAVACLEKRARGFSFLEIMIVMFLFGLLATFAIPQFFTAFEKTSNSELRSLTRVINLLRNESILGNSQYYLIFDPEKQSYHVELQRKEGGRIKVESPKILRPHTFPENFRLENVFLVRVTPENQATVSMLGTATKQPVAVLIDSSGFVSPFTLYISFDEKMWFIQTKNVMGHLELKEAKDV